MAKRSTDRNRKNPMLSRAQERALPYLIASPTISGGCRQAGINPDTYYEWKKQPEFKREFDARSKELVNAAFEEMRLLSRVCLAAIGNGLMSSNESLRVKTGFDILDRLMKQKEVEELLRRIEKLEEEADNDEFEG